MRPQDGRRADGRRGRPRDRPQSLVPSPRLEAKGAPRSRRGGAGESSPSFARITPLCASAYPRASQTVKMSDLDVRTRRACEGEIQGFAQRSVVFAECAARSASLAIACSRPFHSSSPNPQARFKAAAEKAKTLSGLSNEELLSLYKYYKQVRRAVALFERWGLPHKPPTHRPTSESRPARLVRRGRVSAPVSACRDHASCTLASPSHPRPPISHRCPAYGSVACRAPSATATPRAPACSTSRARPSGTPGTRSRA